MEKLEKYHNTNSCLNPLLLWHSVDDVYLFISINVLISVSGTTLNLNVEQPQIATSQRLQMLASSLWITSW